MKPYKVFALIAILGIAAYAPILKFPFISDNYTEIPVSRALGSWHSIPSLISNPVWHFRWSYVFLNSWIVQLFGFRPLPFYVVSICLHVLCTFAVLATGVWRTIGWRSAFWAAAFFAIYEGHQEAVMWLAGWTEMFIVLFGCLCFASWVKWLYTANALYYVLACCAFVGVLFSKESGYIVGALLALPVVLEKKLWKRGYLGLIPFMFADLVYVGSLALHLQDNPRASDGSFSLSAPMLVNLTNSLWHLIFVWGLLALAFLIAIKARQRSPAVIAAFVWMIVALAPYSFLTYMHRVPSRQTYLASVGLAWLCGLALSEMRNLFKPRILVVAFSIVALVNIGILWTKKRWQFMERAAPTDALVEAARRADGAIHLSCFPYPFVIAQAAVMYADGEVIADGEAQRGCAPHWMSFSYKDREGKTRSVNTRTVL
jgi:hypothetical protein